MQLARAANSALRRVPVWCVYGAGVVPALWLFWLGLSDGLGPDPVKALEHRLGEIALQLMVAVLAVTPLRRLTGVSLLRFRRAIGLLAFFYVLLHLAVWLVLDIQLNWSEIWTDILERPYITIGMAGFVLLVPLALTSNDMAVRRMGARAWSRLHRLTYLAALAGAVHYLMLVKAWPVEPLLYLAAVVALLGLRLRLPRRSAAMQA
jgi:methionine sulfoxide reductase heme-binding subunit